MTPQLPPNLQNSTSGHEATEGDRERTLLEKRFRSNHQPALMVKTLADQSTLGDQVENSESYLRHFSWLVDPFPDNSNQR